MGKVEGSSYEGETNRFLLKLHVHLVSAEGWLVNSEIREGRSRAVLAKRKLF
jgi:hypothetical protein